MVKTVFHLSLRATQGFLESVVELMGVALPVPDYSTVCRRQDGTRPGLALAPSAQPRHVVIDTTGLKVYGAGEWYVRRYGLGRGRRRIWRKLHVGVDETTKQIVAVDLTESNVHDGRWLPELLARTAGDIGQVSADKAYDSATCYEAILARGAVPTIPPRRKARLSHCAGPPPARAARDEVLRCIKAEGRYVWRTSSGATRQSMAENARSRFKALLGVKLTARRCASQNRSKHWSSACPQPDGKSRHAGVRTNSCYLNVPRTGRGLLARNRDCRGLGIKHRWPKPRNATSPSGSVELHKSQRTWRPAR